jgi:putative transport protein
VLTVISTVRQMLTFDDEYMREVSDSQYLSLAIKTKEIIVTENLDGSLVDLLSAHGIVLQSIVLKNGKKLSVTDAITPARGMTVKVSGVESSIEKAASALGYVKEMGIATDVPFVFTALAASVIFGALKICGFGLGDSTCALILGLVCGWFYNKNPRYGKFPESTRWFLKSVGLNLFIAAKALTTGLFAFDTKMLIILGVGVAVTLVPHIVTLFFCKYALKMDDADVLGGQCGSGTCTAALNSLTDAAGSSVFTASYATTNAVANILLTVLGVLLSSLL